LQLAPELWYARRHSLRSCPPRALVGSGAAETYPLGFSNDPDATSEFELPDFLAFYLWFAPVGLALLVLCVVGVYAVRAQKSVARLFLAVWIAAVVVQAVVAVTTDRVADVPRQRGVGDLVALALVCGLPLIPALVLFSVQREVGRALIRVGSMSFTAGLLIFLATPWTALIVGCMFGNECI
jgi:hypothetical protein